MDAAHLSFAEQALRYREPVGGRATRRGDVLARHQDWPEPERRRHLLRLRLRLALT